MKPILRRGFSAILTAFCLLCADGAWADELQKPDKGKKVRVFLFAGQSNMEGRADGNKLSEGERQRLKKVQKRVQLAFNQEPVRPLDVVEPSAEIREIYQRDRIFGPELFFGIALSEAWPEERILLVKLSAGQTSLYGSWNPDWSREKAIVMGEEDEPKLYRDLIDYIKEVLSGYEVKEYEICAMLWVQGESDGRVKVAAEEYGNNLSNLIEQTREDINHDTLPFIMFQVGREKVVEGMKRAAQEIPNVTLLPQSQDSSSTDFYQKMENGHYNYEGMKKIGDGFARVFLSEYSGDRD